MSCSHVWCDKFGVFFFSIRAGIWVPGGERLDFISGARFQLPGGQRKPRDYLGVCQLSLERKNFGGISVSDFDSGNCMSLENLLLITVEPMHTVGFGLQNKLNSTLLY